MSITGFDELRHHYLIRMEWLFDTKTNTKILKGKIHFKNILHTGIDFFVDLCKSRIEEVNQRGCRGLKNQKK